MLTFGETTATPIHHICYRSSLTHFPFFTQHKAKLFELSGMMLCSRDVHEVARSIVGFYTRSLQPSKQKPRKVSQI